MGEATGIGRLPIGSGVEAAAPVRLAKLTNLQALRAVAALFVALLHAAGSQLTFRDDGRFVAYFNGHLGSFGVALFFAISGFLMAELIRTTTPGQFLAHRVVRIYPIFLLVVGLSYLLRSALGIALPFDWPSLTLAPAGTRVYPLGNVEWTLVHEVVFYLGLFLVAAAGFAHRLEIIAAGWLAALVGLALAGVDDKAFLSPSLHTILLSDTNAAFAGGLLIPWLMRRRLLPWQLCVLSVPAVAIVIARELEPYRWTLGIPAIFVVAALVQLPQISARGVLGEALVRFGDWSYVLYLAHLTVFTAFYEIAPASVPALPMFAGAMGLALLATAVLGPLDLALYRRLRAAVDRAGPVRCTRAATAFVIVYLAIGAAYCGLYLRDEAEIGRVRAALAGLAPGRIPDAASLERAAAAGGAQAPDSVMRGFDRAVRLPDGKIFVVGWAIDTAQPGDVAHLAVACEGKVAVIGRPRRYRADVAARLGRPDLRRVRFGFTLTVEAGTCGPDAPLTPIFVDGRSRFAIGDATVPTAAARRERSSAGASTP